MYVKIKLRPMVFPAESPVPKISIDILHKGLIIWFSVCFFVKVIAKVIQMTA